MATDLICQSCGIEAPTRYVEYYQNIGALFMRFHKRIKGRLCKRCVHKYFWKFTLTNVTLGWWGYISVIVTPFFVINNVGRYVASLRLARVPLDAKIPVLGGDAVSKLSPHTEQIVSRINGGESLDAVAIDIARRVSVTPGQVVLFVYELARQQRQQPAPERTYGFPVQPVSGVAPAPRPVLPVEADQPL